MKNRFFAALLTAALSITLLPGCAVPARLEIAEEKLENRLDAAEEIIENALVPAAPAPAAAPAAVTEPAIIAVPVPSPTAPAQTNRISKEEAEAIALKDAGFTADQVTHLHSEFDYDEGRPEYEVEFCKDGFEYDYEIHAETGVILHRDKDWDD